MNMHASSIIRPSLTALALLSTALGCSDEPLHDLGYTNNALSESSDEPAPPLPAVAQFAREFAGVWVGGADDPLAVASNADESPPLFRFPSGSSRIRLELSVTDEEVPIPEGTITFGDAPPPPAPDPDLGNPVEPDISFPELSLPDNSLRPPVEGFVYRVSVDVGGRDLAAAGTTLIDWTHEGFALDGKFDAQFHPIEVFSSWCEQQTNVTCAPAQEIGRDSAGNCLYGDSPDPVDCLKAMQCQSSVCTCDEGSPCRVSADAGTGLTLRLSDDGLVGLFTGIFLNERSFQQPLGTARFQRETAVAQP